jgi:hypothetical protein
LRSASAGIVLSSSLTPIRHTLVVELAVHVVSLINCSQNAVS